MYQGRGNNQFYMAKIAIAMGPTMPCMGLCFRYWLEVICPSTWSHFHRFLYIQEDEVKHPTSRIFQGSRDCWLINGL